MGLCLLACLVTFGFFSFMLMWNAEDTIYRDNFSASAEEITDKITSLLKSVADDGSTLSNMHAVFYPEESQWPHAYINGFTDIASTLSAAAPPFGGIYVMPIVYPENVSAFEDYMQDAYNADRDISHSAGTHEFGFGIFGVNKTTSETYHDVKGARLGENRFLTPVTSYVDFYDFDSHMWNAYSDYELFSKGVDGVYSCILAGNSSCQALLESDNSGPVPGTLIITPICPRNSRNTTVGFVVTAFTWSVVLRDSLASLADNMYLVVSTNENDAFTTSFNDGTFFINGEGDLHDGKYDDVSHDDSFRLDHSQASVSVTYHIKLYPTKAFYDEFHTTLPVMTTILTVAMIVATAIFFIVYDRIMEMDSMVNKVLLESKKQFIRFVSQEISTPLNAAVKSMQLMDDSLQASISDESLCRSSLEYIAGLQTLFEDVRLNTDVAMVVINDLSHYDKIEIGNMKLEVGIVDIWSLILENIGMFSAQTLKAGVNLTVTDPFGDPALSHGIKNLIASLHVKGDGIRLAQAFRNLVANALKFSEEDDTVEINLKWLEHGLPDAIPPNLPLGHFAENMPYYRRGSVSFSVTYYSQEGSPENIEQIFSDDLQIHGSKLQTGHSGGLGLFICKGIIDLHSGNIWASSGKNGNGTTFCIELPLFGDDVGAPSPSKNTSSLLSKALENRKSLNSKIWPGGKQSQNYVPLQDENDSEVEERSRTCEIEMFGDKPPRSPSTNMRTRSTLQSFSLLHRSTLGNSNSFLNESASSSDNTSKGSHLESIANILTENMKIRSALIVDDALSCRKLLSRSLQQKGFSCDMAEDGVDCLEILSENCAYDVILMDLVMPKVRIGIG